jgi:hypothetical protein
MADPLRRVHRESRRRQIGDLRGQKASAETEPAAVQKHDGLTLTMDLVVKRTETNIDVRHAADRTPHRSGAQARPPQLIPTHHSMQRFSARDAPGNDQTQ